MDANEILDNYADSVERTPAGYAIAAPWSSGFLSDESQAAGAALIRCGIIGARESRNGKVKLYLGRNNAGNPIFRLFPGWTFCLILWGWSLITIFLGNKKSFLFDGSGLLLSIIALLYFCLHGFAHMRYAQLFANFGRAGEQVKLGSCMLGVFMASGAIWAFLLRIF